MENQTPLKRAEWVGLLGLLLHLFCAALTFVIHRWNASDATLFEGWHFLGGAGIWLLVYLQLHARRRVQEEILAEKAISSDQGDQLFAHEAVEDPLSARGQLSRLEQWGVPLATLVLGGLLIVGAVSCFLRFYHLKGPLPVQHAPVTTAFMTGFAFFAYLFAKYALGMATQRAWRLLRAGGSYLFSNALFCLAIAIGLALCEVPLRQVEYYLSGLLSVLMGLVGVELLLNLVLDFYRPRIKGQEVRAPYDSRILELLSGGGGLLKAAAHTLDYQFGFKVSQTWFWRFMEKAIAPLILFQLLALYLISCVVIVAPYQQAVLERFGSYHCTLDAGLHFKWPWPIEAVYRYPVKRLQYLTLGMSLAAEEHEASGQPHAVLYTRAHGHAQELILVGQKEERPGQRSMPVNFLVISLFMQYRINDLFQYVYHHAQPRILLEGIAYRELIQMAASIDLMEVMGPGKRRVEERLQERIQLRCQENGLGVEIMSLGIQNAHPPLEVAASFEEVIAAMENKVTALLKARTHEKRIVPLARAQAHQIRCQAHIFQYQRKHLTQGEAQEFVQIRQAYARGGYLYLIRKYLQLLEDSLARARVYIFNFPARGKEITILNLEEQPKGRLETLNLADTPQEQ